MKKIIYILNHYSSKSTEHFYHIINLLEKIAEDGVKIILIIERSDGIPEINHENIKVICQKKKSKISRTIELYKLIKKYTELGFNKIFVRISINSTIVAILARRKKRDKVFYWQSGTTYSIDKQSYANKFEWFFKKYLKFKFLITNIDHFVTGPKSMGDYYVKEVGVKKEKIKILYNDIDINRFSKVSLSEKIKLREEMGIPAKQKIVLIVHRLSPVRKTDYYIPFIIDKNVFEANNVKIIVVGDGPEKKQLVEEIDKRGYNNLIEFLGAKKNSDIEKYYKVADIFLNPSYTEGFPRVIIEAMASGLPVISTDAGGTKDLFIGKQTCFIIPKEDRETLKSKLNEMLTNKIDLNALSEENLKRVKLYSTESVSQMYIKEIFNE